MSTSSIPVPEVKFVSTIPLLASLDIQRSMEFYRARLGFEVLFAEQGAYAVIRRGAVGLHFWACSDSRIAENTSCRVRVVGIDALYAHCVAAGIVHPNSRLETKPWGTREFGILDPDRNLVIFAEHDDG